MNVPAGESLRDSKVNVSLGLVQKMTEAFQRPADRSLSPGPRRRSPSPCIVDYDCNTYTLNDCEMVVPMPPTCDAQREYEAQKGVPVSHGAIKHTLILPESEGLTWFDSCDPQCHGHVPVDMMMNKKFAMMRRSGTSHYCEPITVLLHQLHSWILQVRLCVQHEA